MGRGKTSPSPGVGVTGAAPTRSIWSEVSQSSVKAPCTRTRHAATTCGRDLYVLGGRKGNISLKDFWRFNLDDENWEEIVVTGERPGYLQDHSMVEYQNKLYVFGGEISFCNDQEIPLWIFDIEANTWQRESSCNGGKSPKSLRGHSATVYKESMFIFGGYQDLKGSNADVWMFHFPSKSWHLIFRTDPTIGDNFAPTPRHNHTAVKHRSNLWIYGGLNNLQPSSDFLKFDLDWQTWQQVRTKNGPGNLHSHCAGKYRNKMVIVGGKTDGQLSPHIWLFHFETETWEKLGLGVNQPSPRHNYIALIITEELKHQSSEDYFEGENTRREGPCKKEEKSSQDLSSRLRQAVSQTGLSRLGSNHPYTSLTNLYHTSQDYHPAGDTVCVFNKRSSQVQLQLRQQQPDTSQEDFDEDVDCNHDMFATALHTPLIDTTDPDCGVELQETYPSHDSTDTETLLVIGGMLEGQVHWKKENLVMWNVKFSN